MTTELPPTSTFARTRRSAREATVLARPSTTMAFTERTPEE